MANEFTFGAADESISVRIEASKRSLNDNQTYSHRIDSTVSLNLGAFSGSFKAEFAIQDLVLLHERLISAFGSLSETVQFRNKEEDVSLTIEVKRPGGAIINNHYRKSIDAEVVLATEIATKAVVGNAVSIIVTSLLPSLVL